jgi:Bardet-Biedl syndrome 9 protein
MTGEEYELLKSHLSPHIDDDSENGWEEITNAAMTSLLKGCLSKGSSGGINSQSVSSVIKPLTDIGKLKQHITVVCDKISKGLKIEI